MSPAELNDLIARKRAADRARRKEQTRIQDRIRAAFGPGERELSYHILARRVFPAADYPKAWRYSSNGGPPGCYMALSTAIRRMDLHTRYTEGSERFVARPRQ